MIIAPRHCGPPGTGNGGYVAGSVAAPLPPGPATVRLSAPTPLDRELSLEVREIGGTASSELRDGDLLVATGSAVASPDLDALEVPRPVGVEDAREAARGFAFSTHPFPGCFVCGPDNPSGLHIYPAAAPGRPDVVAAPAVLPEASLPVVWAALDCPGAFAVGMAEGEALLLGTMSATLEAPVPTGEELVVLGWSTGASGRKRTCGTALLDASGTVLARAAATWLSVAR